MLRNMQSVCNLFVEQPLGHQRQGGFPLGHVDGLPFAGAATVVQRGKRVDDVTFVSPVQVDVVIPGATPSGPADLVLRAGKVAGPMGSVTLA